MKKEERINESYNDEELKEMNSIPMTSEERDEWLQAEFRPRAAELNRLCMKRGINVIVAAEHAAKDGHSCMSSMFLDRSFEPSRFFTEASLLITRDIEELARFKAHNLLDKMLEGILSSHDEKTEEPTETPSED